MYIRQNYLFMEIKHLRLIKNIVELGSLAKSKDKLCLTQSALSHQLKDAENQAGTALFVRSNKKLILTVAGEIVYRTANEVLEKMDKLDNKMTQIARGKKGIIRICTACFTNYLWLPRMICQFNQQHPQIEVIIYPEYINDCFERLQNQNLDAVIMNKPDPPRSILFHEIMNDEMVAIVPKQDEWAKKKYITAGDFKGRDLIVFSKPMNTVMVYEKVLKPNGIEPKHIYETPMTESMVEMVISGMGVAVIPNWIAKPYIDQGKIVPVRVTAKGLFRSLGIGFLQTESQPVYYNVLIEFLKENLRENL